MNLVHDSNRSKHYTGNYVVKNLDCPSGLVIMTHKHNDSECLSPRDYVDTMFWLAYEKNPYSTHWVRSGSCHREMSQGYDILPAITQLWANTNIRLLHNVTTPWCSELRGCANLPQPIQPLVAAPLLAWLGSIAISMTRHLHHAAAKSPQQHHHQNDSTSTSRHG
jgi:hypothetical protein